MQGPLTERIQLTERGRAQLRALRDNGTIQPNALDKIRRVVRDHAALHVTAEDAMAVIAGILETHKSPFDT